MKRLNYTFANTLDGRTIKHVYGWPFYVLCSTNNSTFTVLGPHETVIGRYSKIEYATKMASEANKKWFKDVKELI